MASMAHTFDVERMLDEAVDAMELTKEDLQLVGDVVLERILDRLMEGKGADGQPLAPYRPATRRQRAKRGRTTDIVNLMNTGRMVASLRTVPGKASVTVEPVLGSEREKLKRIESGTRHMEPRVILDANTDDMDAAADLLIARMAGRMNA